MNSYDPEELLLLNAEKYLRRLCRYRWTNLEMEDRLAEVQIAFLCAYRTFPINTGRFLPDFERALVPYMKEINRRNGRLYCADYSLDAPMPARNDARNCTLSLFFAARPYDESKLYVRTYLETLPNWHRRVAYALLSGDTVYELAARYRMPPERMQRILYSIGNRYRREYGND